MSETFILTYFHANNPLDKKDRDVMLVEQGWERWGKGRWGFVRAKKSFKENNY